MRRDYSQLKATGMALAMLATAFGAGTAKADSVSDFYTGKTIDLYIGYSAGGGYDTFGRAVARHIGKHIAGNPTIVPKNRDGAGSMVLANELYNVLPKDGTAIGIIGRAQVLEPLYGNKEAKYDPTQFTWLGSANNEVSICVAWKDTPVNNVEDLKTRGMIVGGTGPGADTDTMPNIMNNVIGTKMTLITGYPGGNDVLLAMERGEVEGRCGYSFSSMKSQRPQWLTDGSVKILVQMSTEKHPELPNVPLIMDLAKTDRERDVLTMNFSAQAMGRPFLAPPGLPADRAKALQDAFMATMKDPEFIADAKKQKLEVTPISGDAIKSLIVGMYAQPADLIQAAMEAKTDTSKLQTRKIEPKFEKEMGTISEVKSKGKEIVYDLGGGKTNAVSISGSRTKVKVGGKDADRGAFKVGMKCDFIYPMGAKAGEIEATEVSCN